MNSYVQILRTYFWRPRFWVLGALYMLAVWLARDERARDLQVVVSGVFSSLIGCFLALHVRRQFASPAAHVVPGFAVHHLAVAGAISGVLWLGIPCVAVVTGFWPPGALSIHAWAGLLTAFVACWPKAIVWLVAMPVALVIANEVFPRRDGTWVADFLNGSYPVFDWALLGCALASQGLAGWWLTRLPRAGVQANDEFTIESSPAQDSGVVGRWMLSSYDEAVDRRLSGVWLRSTQRWRVPTSSSLVQLSLPGACILGSAVIGRALGNWQGWTLGVTWVVCLVMIFVPLGPWHFRRRTMAQELLFPVTRPAYFRQILASLVLDVLLWSGLATVLIGAVALVFRLANNPPGAVQTPAVLIGLALFWSISVFVLGLALATLRWPLWFPSVIGISMVWLLGSWVAIVTWELQLKEYYRSTMHLRHRETPDPLLALYAFIALNLLLGTGLIWWTYRRWVRSDLA